MSAASTLTNEIIGFIYKQGGYAWRANSVGVWDAKKNVHRAGAKKGVSDVLACYRGVLVALEVKIGADRLRPEQEGFLANVRHVGGKAFVAKTFEGFQETWRQEVAGISVLPEPGVVVFPETGVIH